MRKQYNVRVEGNPWVSLLSAIVEQAKLDAEQAKTDAEKADAEAGIAEWAKEAEISVTMDTYLNDRHHGVRL